MVKELKIGINGEGNYRWVMVKVCGDRFDSPYLNDVNQSSLWVLFVALIYGHQIEYMSFEKEAEIFKWLKN